MDHVFLPRQSQDCLPCGNTPVCNCASNEQCYQIARNCTTCGTVTCVPITSNTGSSGSGGVSKGSLAGAIVGVLLFLAIAALFFVWYRRRWQKRRNAEGPVNEVKDVPAAAETVLNRPDPNEKTVSVVHEPSNMRVYSSSHTTIDLDPESQGANAALGSRSLRASTNSNPFEDSHSIQTTSTDSQSMNVIPIALVPPGSAASMVSDASMSETASSGPVRPVRSADLNLNLDHVNVSNESLRANSPSYAQSQRSGASGVSNNRISGMSNASYASDFMEVPTIVTPTQGTIRQVLGVVKAEVVQAPASPGYIPSTPMSSSSLKPHNSLAVSRPPVRSPLATTSFGPSDVVKEYDGDQSPFDDQHFAAPHRGELSPSASVTTFGTPSSPEFRALGGSDDLPDTPRLPWADSGEYNRPTSVSTQAGSIIADIGSATRIRVGLDELSPDRPEFHVPPSAGGDSNRTLYRMTSGKLVTPPSGSAPSALEEQQLRALTQAQAQAQELDIGEASRRVSGSSVLSKASTRADSILESFPFVPPSPISDRPMRGPPHSPLGKDSFATEHAPPQPASDTQRAQHNAGSRSRPPKPPPSRRTLGLSTGSQASAMSTGLGSFPFQIESINDSEDGQGSHSSFQGRQRASLDTLALTSDLSSYPLGFDQDRDSFTPSARR